MKPYRVSSANPKKAKISKDAKTYYPEDYYKRVGYNKDSDAGSDKNRVDALGQRVRDRFNEEIEYRDANKGSATLNTRNLKA